MNLYFIYGARLKDSRRLLRGAGTRGRFIPLERAGDIARPEVRALIEDACRLGTVPLPATGRGRLVIKSISAKQRPRR